MTLRWRGESGANPSRNPEFPASWWRLRQITGNFIDLSSAIGIFVRKNNQSQCLTGKFPARRNRELYGLQQGIKSAHQGNFPSDQGTSSARPARAPEAGPFVPAEEFSSKHDRLGHLEAAAVARLENSEQ